LGNLVIGLDDWTIGQSNYSITRLSNYPIQLDDCGFSPVEWGIIRDTVNGHPAGGEKPPDFRDFGTRFLAHALRSVLTGGQE